MLKDTLVIGFGSEILADESIVPRLIQQLKEEIPEVDYATYLAFSLELLEVFTRYNNLIVVDSVKSFDGNPCDVKGYSLENYSPTLHLENMHDISLPDLVELGKVMGIEMPVDIYIISIEIDDYETISSKLSPILSEGYQLVYHQVKNLVRDQMKKHAEIKHF